MGLSTDRSAIMIVSRTPRTFAHRHLVAAANFAHIRFRCLVFLKNHPLPPSSLNLTVTDSSVSCYVHSE